MSTAVAYAMSDFAGVRVPQANGGCGEYHAGRPRGTDGYPAVECDQCAPALVAGHYGFSATPGGVPLTPDEVTERDLMDREAKAANAAMDVALRRDYARRGQTGAPSIADQVRAMSAADRAALRDMLGEPRRPGRPRKTDSA